MTASGETLQLECHAIGPATRVQTLTANLTDGGGSMRYLTVTPTELLRSMQMAEERQREQAQRTRRKRTRKCA